MEEMLCLYKRYIQIKKRQIKKQIMVDKIFKKKNCELKLEW